MVESVQHLVRLRDSPRCGKAADNVIVYGITGIGLAIQLDVTEKEANGYIDAFLDTYPGVREWMDRTAKQIKSKGFTEMFISGRRRRLYDEVESGKGWLISKAIRQGMNAIIQGLSWPPQYGNAA